MALNFIDESVYYSKDKFMDSHLHKIDQEAGEIKHLQVVYHYYGDLVRRLFLAGGVVILFTLPFLWTIIPILTLVGALAVVGLVFQAGITTPRQEWTAYANTIIAGLALVIFEYSAIFNYTRIDKSNANEVLFYMAQILAIIFFFAFYFAAKTMRAMLLHEQVTKHVVKVEDRDPL